MRATKPVKLRARDAADLKVIGAVLQDALVPLKDVAFLKRQKRFVLVANRFRWENDPGPVDLPPPPSGDASFEDDAPVAPYERVNCGVCFDRVKAVKAQGVDLADRDQILNLLTIESGPGAIHLFFSNDATIRLEISAVHCHLDDLGEPWPTDRRPDHDPDAESN